MLKAKLLGTCRVRKSQTHFHGEFLLNNWEIRALCLPQSLSAVGSANLNGQIRLFFLKKVKIWDDNFFMQSLTITLYHLWILSYHWNVSARNRICRHLSPAWCQFVPSGSPRSSHRSGLHVLLAEMLGFVTTILTFWKQISKSKFIVGIMQHCGWAVGRRWPSKASKQFNFCVNFLSLTDDLTAQIKKGSDKHSVTPSFR